MWTEGRKVMNKKKISFVLALVLIMSTVIFPVKADSGSMAMDVAIGDAGNVFYGKEDGIKVSLGLTNLDDTDIEAVVQVSVYNDRNVLLDKISKDIAIEAKTVCSENIALTAVDSYGFYNIVVKVLDRHSGGCIASHSTEFTVVNVPEESKKNDKLGVVIHERLASYGDPLINLNFADKAGFSNVRSEQTWERYETEKNVYALTDGYKSFLSDEKERDMGHLEILAYGNELYADSWPAQGETELAAFSAYAKELVGDLLEGRTDDRIEVELWNEWNNFDEDSSTWDQFNPRNLTADDYATFCKAVYPAIKEAATEIGVDVDVWGMAACGITWKSFIPYALDAGAGKYMDGISVHPYSNTECPEDFLIEDMEWLYGKIEETYNSEIKLGSTVIREENFDLALKDNLRATEWGWPSAGGDYPDEIGQASYFVRFNILNEQNGYFNKLDYYTINDGGMGNNIEQNFGLIRSKDAQIPYQPKPAYLAAANYNALMTGAIYVKSAAISNEITAYQFKLENGKDMVVAWKTHDSSQVNTPSASDTENAAITLGADSVTVIDMYGNEQVVVGNGTYGFTFDKTPTYIIGDFSMLSTGAYSDSVVNVGNVVYDEDKQTLFVDGEANGDVTIKLVKDGDTAIIVTDSVADGYFSKTISVGSLPAGEYEVAVSVGKTSTIKSFTKVSRDYTKKQNSFVPGMIAVYDATSNTVTLTGEVADWTEDEKITIVCASLKDEGDTSENKYNGFGGNAIDTIVYLGETSISNGTFEKTFTLPTGANGNYAVRCGGTYIREATQIDTQNSANAIVCTFSAEKSTDTFSASALLKNLSTTDATKNATIIIAQYDDKNQLLDVDFEEYTMNKDAVEPTPASISLPLEKNVAICKAFIWNNTIDFVPLVKAITIP